MCRKVVWCYIFALTLLDLSLNNKLSAQGKSHGNGVSIQESLIEEISLQEWGTDGVASGGGGGGAAGAALVLSPSALSFGRRALAAAHALTVTVTNAGNDTLHLASVAGTTPDFHASFFQSKTLAGGANTTFSVVYLGRREGPVAAHLYLHTSKGVHKYPVSAVGAGSPWRVWPLVGLRVPLNATLEPLLTLYNPTGTTVQVSEVYSSGAWLGLALPEGGGAAPRAQWALPPHATRPLVRLRIRPHAPHAPHPAQHAPLTAYIRIKGNMTGGGLVVGVEAAAAPPGEYLRPLQLRLTTRGSLDGPTTVEVEAGNSDASAARLQAGVWGAECGPAPRAPAPPPPPPPAAHDKSSHNGVKADASGVEVALQRGSLDAHQPLTRAARLTLHYDKMWAGYEAALGAGGGGGGGGGEAGAYCAGWVRVGRAALPYSVRLLPGTLALQPPELHFVRAQGERARASQEVAAVNRFPEPLLITHVHFPPEVQLLFHTESLAPLELAAGAAGAALRVRPRGASPGRDLRAQLTLHTNLSDYALPLLLYEGTLAIEWQWPGSADGTLRLGTLGASSTRVVGARLRNPAPAPLCITRLAAHLPPPAAASFQLHPHDNESCVEAGGWRRGVLTVVGGLGEGEAAGSAEVHTRHGAATAAIQLRARAGRLRALPVALPPAAPYVWAVGDVVVESSMAVRMRVLELAPSPALPALRYIAEGEGANEVAAGGRSTVGQLRYAPEEQCRPRCGTGLDLDTPEGAAWAARARRPDEAALREDAALQRRRRAAFGTELHNLTLHMHTDEVVMVPVPVSGSLRWPRVAGAGRARAGLAGVGAAAPLRLRVGNPAATPLLLQLALAARHVPLGGDGEEDERGEEDEDACAGCVWSAASFQVGEWRVLRGAARAHAPAPAPAPAAPPAPAAHGELLLLQPGAELELTVTFVPASPAHLAAYLYLRNNLTIVERVLMSGRGALPAFELAGRKPNASAPILFEVAECGAAGAGVARRALAVRNTGRVPLRLRDWRVAGEPCGARAFRLPACAPLRLAPGETRDLPVHFAADWTRARAHATLTVRAGAALAAFSLQGAARARTVRTCAPAAPRAPFESSLRWACVALAVLALAGAAGLGALDAERALRHHRARREHASPPRAPLDLRALAQDPPRPAPPPPPPRRRRAAPRRRANAPEPAEERRAFERWRAAVGAPGPDPPEDESRSEEEGEGEAPLAAPPPPSAAPPRGDASSSSPDSSPQPRDGYVGLSRSCSEPGEAGDEEEEECGGSSGSETSSGGEEARPAAAWPRDVPARAAAPHPAQHAAPARGSRLRREGAEARREERARADPSPPSPGAGGARPAVRPHARKERAARRRPPSPAPRVPPAPPRAPVAPAAHPPLRWGASWSDVVSRGHHHALDDGGGGGAGPALAPIGSDVRRRLGSHSLFYYGTAPWPPDQPAPPAPPAPPDEEGRMSGGYRTLESVWGGGGAGGGAAWAWSAAGGAAAGGAGEAVRPPPGFAAPRPCRPYDPFQSLASIWTPAALDWRLDSATPPPAAPHTPPPAPPPAPPRDDGADADGH